MNKFEAISMNQMTVKRHMADTSKDVETQLSDIFNKGVYCSLIVMSQWTSSQLHKCVYLPMA
jgi:hypothetical protein